MTRGSDRYRGGEGDAGTGERTEATGGGTEKGDLLLRVAADAAAAAAAAAGSRGRRTDERTNEPTNERTNEAGRVDGLDGWVAGWLAMGARDTSSRTISSANTPR